MFRFLNPVQGGIIRGETFGENPRLRRAGIVWIPDSNTQA